MNQDSSFPPMLPPSTEFGALLFAVLPCLQEAYRPIASFAYHMTELSKLKTLPSMPPLANLRNVEALISDKDAMLHSLNFYGRMFHMPLLSTLASLLQALQFYNTYKEILPGLFSAMNPGGNSTSSLDSMTGLFSGLGGLGGGTDLLSAFGGLSPDMLSSLLSGFSGSSATIHNASSPPSEETPEPEPVTETFSQSDDSASDLYESLYSFLTPEQKEIYEQLMNTD